MLLLVKHKTKTKSTNDGNSGSNEGDRRKSGKNSDSQQTAAAATTTTLEETWHKARVPQGANARRCPWGLVSYRPRAPGS